MKLKGKEKNPDLQNALETMSEAEASFELRIWIGAICFYLLKLGTTPFEELYITKYRRRNFWVGYLLSLTLVVLMIFVLVYFL